MTGHGGLAAVLFDMDGTLLDSERLWDTALLGLAAGYGRELSGKARQSMVGRPDAEAMAIFYRDLGITDPDRAADGRRIEDQMLTLLATDLHWRPGAAALVAEVRAAGVPAALVTSTVRKLAQVALDNLLGNDSFDVVVCGDEVTAPKPDPESYRTAAHLLGVPIHRCVAIEDSPTGLASALGAGAVTIGVPCTNDLAGADGAHLVGSLTEVDLAYLTRLVDNRAGH